MDKTPIKQSSRNEKICIVCTEIPKEPRKIESTKTSYNVKELLRASTNMEELRLKAGQFVENVWKKCLPCIKRLRHSLNYARRITNKTYFSVKEWHQEHQMQNQLKGWTCRKPQKV